MDNFYLYTDASCIHDGSKPDLTTFIVYKGENRLTAERLFERTVAIPPHTTHGSYEAEYYGICRALIWVYKHINDIEYGASITILNDNLFVIQALQRRHVQQVIIDQIETIEQRREAKLNFIWIPREENEEADFLLRRHRRLQVLLQMPPVPRILEATIRDLTSQASWEDRDLLLNNPYDWFRALRALRTMSIIEEEERIQMERHVFYRRLPIRPTELYAKES